MFANMYAAYEALSPKMRALLDDMEAVNDVSLISARRDPAIMEAFKPGTGPASSFNVIGMDGNMSQEDILRESPQAQQAITGGGGGLY